MHAGGILLRVPRALVLRVLQSDDRSVRARAPLTRSASDVLADLAACAQRQAALTAELARSLVAAPAAPPVPSDAPEFLTTAEAAALLGVSASHLKALRAEGRGPHHVRVGRSVRYPRAALSAETVRTPSEPFSSLPSEGSSTVSFRGVTRWAGSGSNR